MIAVAVSTGTSSGASTGSKDSGKVSRNINHNGQKGNISIPPIKVNENSATVTTSSTTA